MIHLGDRWKWGASDQLEDIKNQLGDIKPFDEPFNKCRASRAFVEFSKCFNSEVHDRENTDTTSSHYTSHFEYKRGQMTYPEADFYVGAEYDATCASGVHFFMEEEYSKNYYP